MNATEQPWNHRVVLGTRDTLRLLGGDVLKHGSRLRFQARGWSMWPFVRDGDFITVEPVALSELRVGDVALIAMDDGQVLVHRVVGVTAQNNHIVTWGDSAPRPDRPAGAGNVMGKVVLVERSDRRWRIDSGLYHWAGVLYARLMPWSRWMMVNAAMLKGMLWRGLRP